jgi:cytohesin
MSVRVLASILVSHLFIFASVSPAQPRLELSPAQEQLRTAIDNLDASGIREAVRAGADPNYRYGGRGLSVLGMAGSKVLLGLDERITPATEERLIAVYDVLFETGARLRAYDRDILHGPAIAGAARVAKYLLERGANPNGEDGDGNTPVILATKYGHPEVVTVLVAAGAKPLDSATEARIRLIAAAGRGDLLAFRRELTRGADVNRKGPTGDTALVEAVRGGAFRGGNLIVVRELLKLGANPNMGGRFIGESSPLHAAVFNNEKNFESDNGPTIVDALLKAGAHVSSVAFHRKQTPLHVAAHMQNTKAAILLLKAGAKVMPRDEDGKTPLDLAESSAMIELLKAHGAREQ